jgi:hypothetical protein
MTTLAHHPFDDARGAFMMLQFVTAGSHAMLPNRYRRSVRLLRIAEL